jgi:hypothetical protein
MMTNPIDSEAIDFLLASLKFGNFFLLFGTYLDELDRREGQKEWERGKASSIYIAAAWNRKCSSACAKASHNRTCNS